MDKQQAAREAFEVSYTTRFPLRRIQEQSGVFHGETQEHYETWQAAQDSIMPALVEARDALGDCASTMNILASDSNANVKQENAMADQAPASINAILGDKK